MPIRLTGLQSNMDTESIISELMKAHRTKIDKIEKKKTKTEWKADAWKDLNAKIFKLYNDTVNDLKYTTGYNKKTTSISNSTVAKVSADSTAVDGTQQLEISDLAKSGSLTGGMISTNDGSELSKSTTMGQLGFTGSGSFKIKVNGKETTINVSENSKISDVVSSLNKAGVSANFDFGNKRFFINSKTSGKDGDFVITANDAAGINSLKSLGLYAKSDASTAEYTKWAAYVGASSNTADPNYNAAYAAIYNDTLTAKKDALMSTINSNKDTLDSVLAANDSAYKTYLEGSDRTNVAAEREAAYQRVINNITGGDTIADTKTKLEGDDTTPGSVKSYKKIHDEKQQKLTALVQEEEALRVELADPTTTSDRVTAINNRLTALSNEKTTAEADVADATDDLNKANSDLATLNSVTSAYDTLKTNTDKYNGAGATTLEDDVQTELQARAVAASNALADNSYSSDAIKNDGQDAVIKLNGATFTSSSNTFNVNGLTIVAQEKTTGPVSITTSQDYQEMYDTIKNFISKYNSLVIEMDTLYNADSAKGYEPLTDDEKEAMTESQIEKWEKKIKDSILRRDSTLSDVSSTIKGVMQMTVDINGTKYSLSSFGINTGGYFTTDKNERNAYHIDGDSDDSSVKSNPDKLMKAITSDPNTVVKFFTALNQDLYKTITKKGKYIEGISSSSTVYNDKVMDSEIDDYEAKIKALEKKFTAMEDKYYKQFASMETALAKLQSSTSSITSLLGGGS